MKTLTTHVKRYFIPPRRKGDTTAGYSVFDRLLDTRIARCDYREQAVTIIQALNTIQEFKDSEPAKSAKSAITDANYISRSNTFIAQFYNTEGDRICALASFKDGVKCRNTCPRCTPNSGSFFDPTWRERVARRPDGNRKDDSNSQDSGTFSAT